MDLAKIRTAIRRVITGHATAFAAIGASQTKLLELASVAGFAEHYKAQGFAVSVKNPKSKRFFAVKTSTNGDPWNFSHILAAKDGTAVEIHMCQATPGIDPPATVKLTPWSVSFLSV